MNCCESNGLTGRVITPENPIYQEARQVYNRAVQKFPSAIVYCQNIADVCHAVLWAKKHHICLRIRGGGHNYEGYSTGNEVLDIDLSDMKEIRINEDAHTVTLQSGVNNKDIYEAVSVYGYPFPGGTCSTVGVCGYTLGGGWGLSCRYLGLGCDSLIEVEVVDAKGCVITASLTDNKDLFWACRGGGGGNFGVVVSMTYRLPKKVDKVTYIDIRYPNADQDTQSWFLLSWQEWLMNADKRITMVSRIYNSEAEGTGIAAYGIFYGPPEAALGILSPLLSLGGVKYRFKHLTFLEAMTRIGCLYPPYKTFLSASRFVQRDFTDDECDHLASLIQKRPCGPIYTSLSFYALGGMVSQVSKDDTAFFYRKAHSITWLESVLKESRCSSASWFNSSFHYLEEITRGSYVNFPYSNLPCYLSEYYGEHVCRLKAIKEQYDPTHLFTFPQGI